MKWFVYIILGLCVIRAWIGWIAWKVFVFVIYLPQTMDIIRLFPPEISHILTVKILQRAEFLIFDSREIEKFLKKDA